MKTIRTLSEKEIQEFTERLDRSLNGAVTRSKEYSDWLIAERHFQKELENSMDRAQLRLYFARIEAKNKFI